MDQRPGSSRNDKLAHAPVPSDVSQVNKNAHLANLSTAHIGKICSASNQSRLPPPPDYYGTHMINFSAPGTSKSNNGNGNLNLKRKFIEKPNTSAKNKVNIDNKHIFSNVKYLCKWSVNVKSIKLEQDDDTSLTMELYGATAEYVQNVSGYCAEYVIGSLLAGYRLNIIDENHYAGRVNCIITKNAVITNNGTYHLIGPITKGSPDNLYHACLQINGIPKTWKYILTQFSTKIMAQNQNTIDKERIINLILHEVLMKGFRLIQILMEITVRKMRKQGSTRKPMSFIRYFFHKKLIFGMQTINEKMIQNLKPVLERK